MIDHQLHQLFTAYKEGKLDKQQAARMISQLKNQNGEKATTNQYNPTVYTYDEPYLRDHVFDGKRVVLGVTHASLAFNHFFDKHPHEHSAQMRNLTFVQPIILKEHEQVEVLVSDKEKGGAFSISFRHTPNEPWKPTATGEITACSQEAFAIDIQERASQLRPYIDISQLYSAIRKYELGSSFRTVNSLYVSEQESLIELRWPVEVVDSRHHYNLHPLTLNSMIFGVVPQLMHTGNTISFLPVGIKTLTFYKTDRPVAFIRTHTLNQSGDLISFDAEAMDSEGRVLAVVNGYTLKRMSPPMAEDDASSYQAASGPGKLLNENAGKQDKNEQVLLYLKGKIDRKLSKPLSKSHLERNLMDLGIDSVRLVELSVEIEKDTGIELPPTIFFEYPNLKSLSTHLSQNFEKEINQLFSKEASSNIAPSSPAFEGLKKAENSDHIPSPSKKPENSIRLESIPLQNPVPKHNDLGRFSDSSRETASGDIAVIGMDGKVAGSENLEEFWNHLIKQTDLMSKIPSDRFEYTSCNKSSADGQKISCEWGSFINDVDKFDAPFFNISPREASWMDPQLRLLLQSVYACSEDAGYIGNFRGTDTGMFIGACFRDYADKITEAGLPADPYMGTGNSASALANRASFVFNLQGPSMAVDTACSSSLLALHLACKALQNRECSLAFVGGVNLILSSLRHRYFCNIGALSTTGRCHTFDAAADGYVPGEAIVSVLLKPLSEAEKDNDHIYGVIKGSAALHGGYTPSLTAPSVDGEANVVTKAWEKAGIDPATLSYIEAHGTGTALGDPIEINALKKAFKQYTQKEHFCKIGSAKAHIGHTEAAAGLVGLVKVLLQMKHGQIPAMPAFKQVNPLIALEKSPLAINTESQAWESGQMPKRAGVSSFGFTGAYAHVVVEEYLSVNQKNTIAKSAGWDENHSFLILL
ncbi:MAG: beta-ketoacyl synthase N-terminal-like domain-containing protein, partial [Cyclobacteriaceae bacterium]